MVTLESAIHWVLACCRKYTVPEPRRLAHQTSAEKLNETPRHTVTLKMANHRKEQKNAGFKRTIHQIRAADLTDHGAALTSQVKSNK